LNHRDTEEKEEKLIDQDKFEQFMVRVMRKPVPPPDKPIDRVRVLAQELADGAYAELWDTNFLAPYELYGERRNEGRFVPRDKNQGNYLSQRWNDNFPDLALLVAKNYLDKTDSSHFSITDLAFQLVQEAVTASVFISYSRRDSSALALLIRSRLREKGISDAFIDMTIPAGADWEHRIRNEIKNSDSFILLLGKTSLLSVAVCKEILWASEYNRELIPIWHNKYRHKSG
jgi:hypothetical protein